MPAELGDSREVTCWRNRSRTLSRPLGAAGCTTVTGPIALPTAPIPLNQASRAKSYVPGSAIGGGGARRPRSWTVAPGAIPEGNLS